MGYTLTVDIKSSQFPEFGNPIKPKKYDDVKNSLPKETKTKVKDQFESYYKNASKTSFQGFSNSSTDDFSFSVNYEEGSPKTYTFMGMKIDENYEAIIPVGDGYVRVAPMYDVEELVKLSSRWGHFSGSVWDYANDIIRKSTQDLARVLSTSMKTGSLYDLYRAEDRYGRTPESVLDIKSIRIENLDPFVQLIKRRLNGSSGTPGVANSYKYKSILLNLIDKNKKKAQEQRIADGGTNIEDMDSTVAAAIVYKLFSYWADLSTKYSRMYTLLSSMDLWSDLCKNTLGDNEFNSRIKSSYSMVNTETGELVTGKIISFAGVSRDDSLSDANSFRASAASQLDKMANIVSGDSSSEDISVQDLMLGNIEYEDFGNPFELNAEELQAVSSYDSLKYVDEDANACRESYNMNDPEERGLFIKSAIKSYDRNFRTFKSTRDYDVAQAFSDMVEKGVTFGDRIVSKKNLAEPDITNYEVTATEESLKRSNMKKSMVKIGKLLNRSLSDVYDLFGSNTSQQSNP